MARSLHEYKKSKKNQPNGLNLRLNRNATCSFQEHDHGIYEEDEDMYHVDKILRRRKVKGKFKYLVKWTGYSDQENSWVFDVTPDLKKAFTATLRSRKRKRASAKTTSSKNSNVKNIATTQRVTIRINKTSTLDVPKDVKTFMSPIKPSKMVRPSLSRSLESDKKKSLIDTMEIPEESANLTSSSMASNQSSTQSWTLFYETSADSNNSMKSNQ